MKKYYKKPAPVVKQARVILPWSQYNKDIFHEVAHGEGNTHVDALAGSGKTTCLVESFYHIPPGLTTLMVAFNKSIQLELERRAPANVEVKTLHSLGFAAARRAFPKLQLDNDKLAGYLKAEHGDAFETRDLRESLTKAVGLCKNCLAWSEDEIDPIMDQFGIDPCTLSRKQFIASVHKLLVLTKNDTARVDFNDMIWFPVVHNLTMFKYDRVMVDEAQDLNACQHWLVENSLARGGRLLSCGDANQAIYSWTGADSRSIDRICERFNSKRLPLSVTYRCARAIVELAQSLVPTLEPAPNAEDGLVETIVSSDLIKKIHEGDFLLSRTNAPLIRWCLDLLKNGTKANIQGRDLGKNLAWLIKKSEANSVDGFLGWLDEYLEAEVTRLLKANRDVSIVQDKVECLRTLCEGTRSLDQVKANIDHLFHDGDDKDRVILSTTHKAKGLERNTYKPGRGGEEANLYYVAITRSKKELFLVAGK